MRSELCQDVCVSGFACCHASIYAVFVNLNVRECECCTHACVDCPQGAVCSCASL